MSELATIKEFSGVQVAQQIYVKQLTKGQKGILMLMDKLVKSREPLTILDIVTVYYQYINKKHFTSYYSYDYATHRHKAKNCDILEEFALDSTEWRYAIRPRVRQWFINNLGSLILKGELVVLPVISIADSD